MRKILSAFSLFFLLYQSYVFAQPCSNISLNLDCNGIVKTLPYVVDFSGTQGGVLDANGIGTGFTMVQPHSAARHSNDQFGTTAPFQTYPAVPGYEPSRISLTGGNLQLIASRGIAYLKPPASSNNNNQVNTLGVGMQVNSNKIRIATRLIGITTGTGSAQAGIWFGIDEDNFLKLNVTNNQIEARLEELGLSDNVPADQIISAPISNVVGGNVILEIEIDPAATNNVTCYYTIGTGSRQTLGSFSAISSLFNGASLPSGPSGITYAGIYNTYRIGSVFTATFDYFSVEELLPEIAVSGNSQAITNGDLTPATSDHTDFGLIGVGGNLVRTFTLQNTRTAALNLTGATPVTLSGANANQFSVTQPASLVLQPNASTTFTVTFTPNASGVKLATVNIASNDGAANPFTFGIKGEAPSDCPPISTLECAQIPVDVTSGLSLDWNSGSIPGTVAGTGFTMVMAPSQTLASNPAPTNAAIPGLVTSNLAFNNGELVISASKGIMFSQPASAGSPNSTETNTQQNALGIGMDADAGIYVLQTTIVNPNFALSASNTSSQQAGLWFGLDEDNYIKLVAVKDGSANSAKIQWLLEQKIGAAALSTTEGNTTAFTNFSSNVVVLRIVLNPFLSTATFTYSLNGGTTFQSFSPTSSVSVPASFWSGVAVGGSNVSYAGIHTTLRRADPTPTIPFRFDQFSISPVANALPIAGNNTATTFQGVPVTFNVAGNDSDTDALLLLTSIDLDPNTAGQQSSFTAAGEGTYVQNGDGTVTFTPLTSFSGLSTISYTISDNGGAVSLPATIEVTVNTCVADAGTNAALDCATGQATLSGTSSSGTFLWTTADGNIVSGANTANPVVDAAGTYTLTVNGPLLPAANPLAKINFQNTTASTTPPAGWEPDFGLPYGPKANGLTYGWVNPNAGFAPLDLSAPNGGNGRNRSGGSNPAYNTLSDLDKLRITTFHMQYGDVSGGTGTNGNPIEGAWELEVANGTYRVFVSLGDWNPISADPEVYFLNVEGTAAITNFVPSGAAGASTQFVTATVDVTVTDGKLTIDALPGTNTKINHATITLLSPVCTDTDEVVISGGASPVISQITETNPSDCGLNDGSIAITASGSSLEYSIDNGTTFQPANVFPNLAAGVYNIVVRVAGAPLCAVTDNVTLDPKVAPSITLIDEVDPSDCGLNDGEIVITATGTNLEYSIDNGVTFQVSNEFTGLGGGSFDVVVREVGSTTCVALTTASLTAPVAPSITIVGEVDPSDCGLNDGEIVITASGTNLEYSIDNGVTFQVSNEFTGLGGGSFDVVVSEVGSTTCVAITTASLTAPVAPSITNVGEVDPSDCGLSDGEIVITATGTNLEYSIDNGVTFQVSNEFTGLGGGSFNVVVREVGSTTCVAVTTASLTAPVAPSITNVGEVDPSDCGLNDGEIVITATGTNLEYSIDNGVTFQMSNEFIGLDGGSFDVVVREVGSTTCIATTTASLTAPVAPSITNVDEVDPSDCGLSNGEIVITATGTNLEYSIDNGVTFQVSNEFTGLDGGSFDVVVREVGSTTCIATTTANLTAPLAPSITNVDEVDPSDCGLSNGEIIITATGTNLEYSINNGVNFEVSNEFTGLGGGNYDVVVRTVGSTTCVAATTASLTAPVAPSITNVGEVDPSDCGLNDGEIVITATGTNLEYSIDNGVTFQVSNEFTGLGGGNYDVVVRTVGLTTCVAVTTASLTAPVAPSITNVDEVDPSDCGLNDGEITISAIGSNLEYSINGGASFGSSSTFTSLGAATYNVVIREVGSNTCTDQSQVILAAPSAPSITGINVVDEGDCGASNGSIEVIATGSNLEYSIDGITFGPGNTFGGLSTGAYTVEVRSAISPACAVSQPTQVDGPSAPVISLPLTFTEPGNCGVSDGSITLIATGQNLEYSVDGGTNWVGSNQFDNLAAGSYALAVRVVNTQNCVATESLTLNAPVSPVLVSIVEVNPDDCGVNNGSIEINATGTNLEYSINNGGTFQSQNLFTSLAGGTFEVVVRNSAATACLVTDQATLEAPVAPVITLVSSTNPSGCGVNDGTVTVTATGTSLEYSIDGGQTFQVSNEFTGLGAGTFQIAVRETQANGCVATDAATLNVNDVTPPTARCQILVVQLDATGNASITAGQIDDGSSDNCGIQSISVSPNTFTTANIGINNVTLTVTDVNGNISTCNSFVIVQAASLALSGNGQPIVNGDLTAGAADDTDFGLVPQNGGNVSRTFTVTNNGTASLILSSISTDNAKFGITNFVPNTVVATGTITTFTIAFDDSGTGAESAVVTVVSNDSENSPFTFGVKAEAFACPIAGQNGLATVCVTDAPFDLSTVITVVTPGGSWFFNGNPLTGSTFTPGTDPAGVYTYTVTGQNGCASSSASATIIVSTCTPVGPLEVFGDTVVVLPFTASVTIPVRVKNYSEVLLGQGSVRWNANVLDLTSVSNYGLPYLDASSVFQANDSTLNFSYADFSGFGSSLPDSAILFELTFSVLSGFGTASDVTVADAPVPLLFSDLALNPLTVISVPGRVEVNPLVPISVEARSELGDAIPTVTFTATGLNGTATQTGNVGTFQLSDGSTQQFGALKNNDVDTDNGINTLDIIRIQRHIQGVTQLASPYRILAADVNNSNGINVLDVILMRQMVLQTRTYFPSATGINDRLWTFVGSDVQFPNPASPFLADSFLTVRRVRTTGDYHLIGVKLGDVDNTWNPLVARPQVAGTVGMNLDAVTGKAGEWVEMAVRAQDFGSVSGYQGTLTWDASVLEFGGVTAGATAVHVATDRVQEGKLPFTWNDPAGGAATVADGEALFTLRFRAKGAPNAAVSLSSDLVALEAYTNDLNLLLIEGNAGEVRTEGTTSVDVDELAGYKLFQNEPNPFEATTAIRFELPKQETVTLVFVNQLGQEVYRQSGNFAPGAHTYVWNGTNQAGNELASGIYFCTLRAGAFSATIKLQIVD